MTLKEYLTKNGIMLTWFANEIPCSVPYLCNICHKGIVPSGVIRRRIRDITKGQVEEHEYGVKCDARKYKKKNRIRIEEVD